MIVYTWHDTRHEANAAGIEARRWPQFVAAIVTPDAGRYLLAVRLHYPED